MQRTMTIVNKLPLESLICKSSSVEYLRGEYLSGRDLKKMLTSGPLQFVLVSIGNPVRWQDLGACYKFWKSEIQPHLAQDPNNIDLSIYPNGYAYVASYWKSRKGEVVVVLETHH